MSLRDPQVGEQNATGFEVIRRPLSAWIVSWFQTDPAGVQVSWMNPSASIALSRWATIQPTT
jgi:hypothetical protein